MCPPSIFMVLKINSIFFVCLKQVPSLRSLIVHFTTLLSDKQTHVMTAVFDLCNIKVVHLIDEILFPVYACAYF